MVKKEISLMHCTEMSVLAEDILNNQGVPLVVKNTLISEFIKGKLLGMNFERVWVYESEESTLNIDSGEIENIRKDYLDCMVYIKELLNGLSSGKRIDPKKIEGISEIIYKWKYDQSNVIEVLGKVKSFDEYTYTHCVNTAFYSMLMAQWLMLSEKDIKKAIQVGLLHDIGKIRIPSKILNKKGALTNEEFEEIKKHSLYGYNILIKMSNVEDEVINGVLGHHERADGTGYPFGLKGDDMNLFAKIVAIADVYDAMISDRVYKKGTSPFEVFKFFLTTGMRIFDSSILKLFIKNISVYYIGLNVNLNNSKTGEVVFIPPNDVGNPVICVDSEYIDLSRESHMKIISIAKQSVS